MNFVELMADGDECAFDQRCIYGQSVDGHAVYCHNADWPAAPRKCRRTWYYGEKYATENGCRDEDCPGFKPNPEFPDAAMSAKTSDNPC